MPTLINIAKLPGLYWYIDQHGKLTGGGGDILIKELQFNTYHETN